MVVAEPTLVEGSVFILETDVLPKKCCRYWWIKQNLIRFFSRWRSAAWNSSTATSARGTRCPRWTWSRWAGCRSGQWRTGLCLFSLQSLCSLSYCTQEWLTHLPRWPTFKTSFMSHWNKQMNDIALFQGTDHLPRNWADHRADGLDAGAAPEGRDAHRTWSQSSGLRWIVTSSTLAFE